MTEEAENQITIFRHFCRCRISAVNFVSIRFNLRSGQRLEKSVFYDDISSSSSNRLCSMFSRWSCKKRLNRFRKEELNVIRLILLKKTSLVQLKNNKMITNLHKNRNHRIVVIKLLMRKKQKLNYIKYEIKIRDILTYI